MPSPLSGYSSTPRLVSDSPIAILADSANAEHLGAFAAGVGSEGRKVICIGAGEAPKVIPPVLWHRVSDLSSVREKLRAIKPSAVLVDGSVGFGTALRVLSESSTSLRVPTALLTRADDDAELLHHNADLVAFSCNRMEDVTRTVHASLREPSRFSLVYAEDSGMFLVGDRTVKHHPWPVSGSVESAASLGKAIALWLTDDPLKFKNMDTALRSVSDNGDTGMSARMSI